MLDTTVVFSVGAGEDDKSKNSNGPFFLSRAPECDLADGFLTGMLYTHTFLFQNSPAE